MRVCVLAIARCRFRSVRSTQFSWRTLVPFPRSAPRVCLRGGPTLIAGDTAPLALPNGSGLSGDGPQQWRGNHDAAAYSTPRTGVWPFGDVGIQCAVQSAQLVSSRRSQRIHDRSMTLMFVCNLHHDSGRWKEDEHARFVTLMGEYGQKWAAISQVLGTRTPKQVRFRFQVDGLCLLLTSSAPQSKPLRYAYHFSVYAWSIAVADTSP